MALINALNYRKDLYLTRTAKNKAFEFIPAAQEWQLDIKWRMNLRFIHESNLSKEQKEDIISLLAFRAQHLSQKGLEKTIWGLIAIFKERPNTFTASSFDKAFKIYVPDSYKGAIKYSIKAFINAANEFKSQVFNAFYLNHCQNLGGRNAKRRHLDSAKGAHTPAEFDSLFEGARMLIQKMHQELDKPRPFYAKNKNSSVGFLMGGMLWILMLSILRRPVQLAQIKMGDFRTSDGEFVGWGSSNSTILMDYDELKLQTYRAKTGLPPRSDLDTDLHLLNRQNSLLILKYSSKLFLEQIHRLKEVGITLSPSETKDLFKKYPIFPSYTALVSSKRFGSKCDILQYLSFDTLAGHSDVNSLITLSQIAAENILRPIYFSDRVPDPARVSGNNRIRHTVLTSMAREGVDVHTLAAITGVSVNSVRMYVDMSPEERILVDEILGKNAALSSFGKVRIQDQMYEDDDLAFNEYGDSFGSHEKSSRCTGCREVLPVPLSCYGCDNFNAFVDADHTSERDKAIKKYKFNINNGQSEDSLKRLAKAIEYIDITIIKCEQRKYQLMEIGTHD